MVRSTSLALLLLALLLATASPRPATAAPAPPMLPTGTAVEAAPAIQAKAAVAIEAATGAVLYEKNAHERLPPASLTKMATSLVALDQADPAAPIVATESSLAEPTVIGMEPGDRLPLREALYGMLLQSGNDAALAIAESIGRGSIPRFVGWMNALVESLGLIETRFANPNGLDVGEHYSSAYDMAVISRVLMRQPLLREIVATPRHDFTGPPLWAFRNINPFLASYAGADGIKTGYETRAGRCLAASATRDGREVIVVVLNSNQYVADSAALMDYAFGKLARAAAAPGGPLPARPGGRLQRLLLTATGRSTLTPEERVFLRGSLRSELSALETDPSVLAGGSSVYERLRSDPGQPSRRP